MASLESILNSDNILNKLAELKLSNEELRQLLSSKFSGKQRVWYRLLRARKGHNKHMISITLSPDANHEIDWNPWKSIEIDFDSNRFIYEIDEDEERIEVKSDQNFSVHDSGPFYGFNITVNGDEVTISQSNLFGRHTTEDLETQQVKLVSALFKDTFEY